MKVTFVKPGKVDVAESDIQKEFEKNLEHLDDSGLGYVASYVPIGTGVIDTLAIDDDLNPVMIEYKRPGAFDRDALIQLMNYYSWFASDENHISYIREYIKKAKPELREKAEGMSSDLRLIVVVSDVQDEVKNACYALEPSIQIIRYQLSAHQDGSLLLIPHIILDTREYEREIAPPKTEEDHLKNHDKLRPAYSKLKDRITESIPDARFNPAPRYYIGVTRRKLFCTIHIKQEWIRVDLILTQEEAKNNKRYTKYPVGSWGYTYIRSLDDIDDELMDMIVTASHKGE